MASIRPVKDKEGNVKSYQIQVYRGRDMEGKKLTPYSKTWSIPENWKSEAKIKKELDRVAAEFELECKAGKISTDKKTFQQYSEYVMELKTRDLKHRTVFEYKNKLRRVYDEIGHIKLTDLNVGHLNNFYMKLGSAGANKHTGGPLSEQTINHYHRNIHMILEQAVKERIIEYNIAKSASPPTVDKKEAEYFEIDEVLAIRDKLVDQPSKWKTITLLLIDTGARKGEVLGLKWENIHFETNQITFENNLQYTPECGIYLEESTKNDEDRTINIAPEIMNTLREHKQEQEEFKSQMGDIWDETGFCFTQDNGNPIHPQSIYKWLDNFSKEYNLPKIRPHKFRHTQGSLLYELGANPVAISKRLGHRQVSTTQNIYSHVLEKGDKKISDTLANALYRETMSTTEEQEAEN